MTLRGILADLPVRKVSALKKRAKDLGLSPGAYVKQLVEEDLETDRIARTQSWQELTKPFKEAFRGLSEGDLDEFVDRARRRKVTRRRISP